MKPSTPRLGFKSKALCLLIKGWSAKPNAISLKGILDSFGRVINFVHYPTIQSTFVKIEMQSLKLALPKIAAAVPGIRLERTSFKSVKEAVLNQGCPSLTVFLSRSTYFTENAILEQLNTFGRIRAIEHFYSNKSKRWVCKATFYESYSVETLLENSKLPATLHELLASCKIVKMTHPVSNCVTLNQNKQRKVSGVSECDGFINAPKHQANRQDKFKVEPMRRCFSQSRLGGESIQVPIKEIFKKEEDFINATLSIAKSRAFEITRESGRKRGKSLEKKTVTVDTSKACTGLKSAFNGILSRLNFKLFPFNETSFLGFSIPRAKNAFTETPEYKASSEKTRNKDSESSYLSDSEESDGFTVVEVPGIRLALYQESAAVENMQQISGFVTDYIEEESFAVEANGEPAVLQVVRNSPFPQLVCLPEAEHSEQQKYTNSFLAPRISYFSFPFTS